ncbi:hypothetical protein Poli38472_005869 [Pythium oligandrum]|uniref:Tetraspanin n=1 Tax=Pythium oligandrum TaxID=41045 RepID=A0A8K1FMM2_PYTOL|nr:hypothetical protein Poli38472_005869 [Pythium oligandrum]|eukprot:TMW68401.1 hypothetical protein Poli38472_005869 [Pythium oligandrum]
MGGSKVPRACLTLWVVVINTLLLAGGVLVEYVCVHVKDTGWLDVIHAYWSSIDQVILGLQIFGGVMIGLAVLGYVAATCRWRFGLIVYAIVIFIMLIVFGAIGVVGFIVRNEAEDWKSQEFPANSDEASIKPEFDRVYCYAQGAYICNEISLQDAAKLFIPEVDSTLLAQFNDKRGVNEVCDTFLTLIPSIKPLCDGCAVAKQAQNLSDVLEWANDRCPRTDDTLLWCGDYLVNGKAGSTGTAPYTQCRPEFLDLISSTTLIAGATGIGVAVGSLLTIVFACCLGCRKKSDDDDDDDNDQDVLTPTYNQDLETPKKQQNRGYQDMTGTPLYGHHEDPRSRDTSQYLYGRV